MSARTNLTGTTELTSSMIKFIQIGKERFSNYSKYIIQGQPYKIAPVYVTKCEQVEGEKIDNMLLAEIKYLVEEKLKWLDSELLFDLYKKEVKGRKKDEYVKFFYYLQDASSVDAGAENWISDIVVIL